MKKILLTILSILSISLSQADEITFTVHKDDVNRTSSTLFLFSQPNTKITVANADLSLNQEVMTDSDGKADVTIPYRIGSTQLTLEKAGKYSDRAITISSDSPISAYLLNRPDAIGDLSYLLSDNALGNDYYIPAWYDNKFKFDAQLSITAIEDDTRVVVNSPVRLDNAGFSANTDEIINLNKGETFFITEPVDFSGLHLTSNKKIAVFSSNQCADVNTNGTGVCGPLYSQVIPTPEAAGIRHLIPKSSSTPSGPITLETPSRPRNMIRIIATQDNTTYLIKTNSPPISDSIKSAGLFNDIFFSPDNAVEITSTNNTPIIVTQYINTTNSNKPAMTMIPSIDQWLSNYSYGLANSMDNTNTFASNYLNLVIEKDENNQANVTLNGELIDESEFNPINDDSDYLEASLFVDSVENALGRISANRSFQMTISGFSDSNSFLTIGGTLASPGARLLSPQVASTQTIPSINKLGLLMTALLLITSVTLVIRRRA